MGRDGPADRLQRCLHAGRQCPARQRDPATGDGNALSKYPNIKRLVAEIEARPAAKAAVGLKDKFTFKTEMDDEAKRNMFRHMKV